MVPGEVPQVHGEGHPRNWRKGLAQRCAGHCTSQRGQGYHYPQWEVARRGPHRQSPLPLKSAGIHTELHQVPTYGGKPATKFLASLGPDVLTSGGSIRVKPSLELPEYPHVFAAGDAIDWNESKQFLPIFTQVPVIIANIKSLVENKPLVKEYKGSPVKVVMVTNGRVSTPPLERHKIPY